MIESGQHEECNDSMVDYQGMNDEWKRLGSFSKMYSHISSELQTVRPLSLAKIGIFYNERFNVLICFSCRQKTLVRRMSIIFEPHDAILHEQNCNLQDNAPITVPEKEIYDLIQSKLHEEYCIEKNRPFLHIETSDAVLSNLYKIFNQTGAATDNKSTMQKNDSHFSFLLDQMKVPPTSSIPPSSPDWRIEIESSRRYDTTEKRLTTFKKWPLTSPHSAKSMAEAGFIYLGEGDKVKCVFCLGLVHKWEPSDVPIQEHIKHFPDCFFAKDMIKRINERADGSASGSEITDRYDHIKSKTVPTSSRIDKPITTSSTEATIEIESMRRNVPLFNTINSRMSSFQNWPHPTIKPMQLCLAGFYYTGERDRCKCFSCNVIVEGWSSTDDPYQIHVKQSRTCPYIRQIKGEDFVNRVLKSHEPKSMMEGISRESAIVGVTPSLPTDTVVLMDENEKLKDERQCVICMSEPKSILILPCAHIACCSKCIKQLKKCPVCRSPIKGTVQTFMS